MLNEEFRLFFCSDRSSTHHLLIRMCFSWLSFDSWEQSKLKLDQWLKSLFSVWMNGSEFIEKIEFRTKLLGLMLSWQFLLVYLKFYVSHWLSSAKEIINFQRKLGKPVELFCFYNKPKRYFDIYILPKILSILLTEHMRSL